MFIRCLKWPEWEHKAHKFLGYVYKQQDQGDAAIESFKRALELQSTPVLAFEIATLNLRKCLLPEALEFYTYAIDMAIADSLSTKPEVLSHYFFNRMHCYE